MNESFSLFKINLNKSECDEQEGERRFTMMTKKTDAIGEGGILPKCIAKCKLTCIHRFTQTQTNTFSFTVNKFQNENSVPSSPKYARMGERENS